MRLVPVASMNGGFVKTERLDGDIGYVKFDVFGPLDVCAAKATTALAKRRAK